MKIERIYIENFRSIKEHEFFIGDYNIFVGENNSGKSNLINAVRFFYDEYKISSDDFFNHEDCTIIVEITFKLDDQSYSYFEKNKGKKYLLNSNKIIVRKEVLKNNGEIQDNGRHGILAESEVFDEDNKFFGFKGVSKSLLADIIYIPPLKKLEDELKTTNQSTTIMRILKKIIGPNISSDETFKKLNNSIGELNGKGYFKDVENDLTEMMNGYGCEVQFNFDPLDSADIISRAGLKLKENDGSPSMNFVGKGLGTQRALLINLIRYWAQKEITEKNKSNASGKIGPTIIIIEEPEIFQHPQKQKMLFGDLKFLSNEESTQVFINTHSSHFLIEKDEDLLSLFRVFKKDNHSEYVQIKNENDFMKEAACHKTFKFNRWLNGEKNILFFSNEIILCEGNTEKMVVDHLLRDKFRDNFAMQSRFTTFDCGGKFNMPHFIRLCTALKIKFYLIYDLDKKDIFEKEKGWEDLEKVNNIIKELKQKNEYFVNDYVSKDNIEINLFGEEIKKREKCLVIEKIESGIANQEILNAIKCLFE